MFRERTFDPIMILERERERERVPSLVPLAWESTEPEHAAAPRIATTMVEARKEAAWVCDVGRHEMGTGEGRRKEGKELAQENEKEGGTHEWHKQGHKTRSLSLLPKEEV